MKLQKTYPKASELMIWINISYAIWKAPKFYNKTLKVIIVSFYISYYSYKQFMIVTLLF